MNALSMLTSPANLYALTMSWPDNLSPDDAKWWLSASEALLLISALVLAVGIVGEWPDSDRWKKRVWYRLAKAAVLVGVIGELLGDGGVFKVSARQQVIEEAAIQGAKTDAANATLHAGDAIKDAAALAERAATLEAQAGQLRQANLALQTRVAEAQKTAADAQAEQTRIKSAVTWRVLTDDQCDAIVTSLNGRTMVVQIQWPLGDPEATLFALTIERCLGDKAHWTGAASALSLRNAIPLGILLDGPDKAVVGIVRQAFTDAGLQFGTDDKETENAIVFSSPGKLNDAPVRITVGSRPIIH